MNAVPLTPEDIIAAHAKHQDDFVVIDFNKTNIRENDKKTVKYINIRIKKADGTEVPPIIKFINSRVYSRISAPTDRKFESIKLAIPIQDPANPNSKFAEAMELISNSFIAKTKEAKEKNIITDDEKDAAKNKDIVHLINIKPQVPTQYLCRNKEGEYVELQNPLVWLTLAHKRYKKEDEHKLRVMDFAYKGEDKPFVVKEFDTNIFNLENVINGKPQIVKLTNENVHEFITPGSMISGTVSMQLIVSKQAYNLNTRVSRCLYVVSNKNPVSGSSVFSEDEFSDILADAKNKLGISSEPQREGADQEVDDYETGGGNDDAFNDKINKLSFD